MNKLESNHIKHYPIGKNGLRCMVMHKTIGRVEVKQKIFTLTAIDAASKWKYWTSDREFCYQFNVIGKGFRSCDFKPILHPLSDLTKPIIVPGYNKGKEFIPIVELAKIAKCYMKPEGDFIIETHYFTYGAKNDDQYIYYNGSGSFHSEYNGKDIRIQNQLELLQKLFEWHFAVDIPEGTWIDINTLD